MKKIGLIGGMSWESSHVYYRLINEAVKERLGGLHSAKSIMYSVDFAEIADMQSDGRWDEAGEQMAEAARSLEAAGADLIVLCTNTMHKLASYIEDATKLPFLHIADAAGKAITAQGIKRVALLATRFTMEESFTRIVCASFTELKCSYLMSRNAKSCMTSFTKSCAGESFVRNQRASI